MTGGYVAGVPGLTPARRVGGARARDGRDRVAVRGRRLLRRQGRLQEARPPGLVGLRRRPDAARDLAAAAARRRRQDGVRPAVRRHRLRAADAVCAGAEAGDRHVRDLHRLGDLGGRHPPGPGAPRLPPGIGHRLRGWSWSAWSRTASRSPTRPTRGCSTSSASTPRRRSSSPTSPAAPSERRAPRAPFETERRREMHLHLVRVAARPEAGAASGQGRAAARSAARRASRRHGPAARPSPCRMNDEPHALQHEPAAPRRMWRNRNTHRPQKPAVERP